jgi:hypothetical protein
LRPGAAGAAPDTTTSPAGVISTGSNNSSTPSIVKSESLNSAMVSANDLWTIGVWTIAAWTIAAWTVGVWTNGVGTNGV